jgi:hypothetical protein
MAFTRFKYDDLRTKKELQESTGASRWILNTPGQGTDLPYVEDPRIRLQKWGGNLRRVNGKGIVDIESELDGRSRTHTNCYSRGMNSTDIQSQSTRITYKTQKSYIDETRVSHPSWMYRDLEQTRWEYPLMNPQENVCKRFENNISTRILEKDHHKPIIPIV